MHKNHIHISVENGRRIKCISWTIIGSNLLDIYALALIYVAKLRYLMVAMTIEMIVFSIFLLKIHKKKAKDHHLSIVIGISLGLTFLYFVGGVTLLILLILVYKIDHFVEALVIFTIIYLIPRSVAFCFAKFAKIFFKPV